MEKRIIAVVTGMQHSGTTYLNNLLNSHSQVMSGFECGILLGNINEYHKIKPFSDWLTNDCSYFGLPNNYLNEIKNKNYKQVYEYIHKNKGSKNNSNIQKLIKHSKYFTDKTPAYIYNIENINNKIFNLDIPIIITLKKYDEIYYSWVVKRNIGFNAFIKNLRQCTNSLRYIMKNKPKNIYLFEYNDYIQNKESYNKFFMDIILKHNKGINIEKLSEEKYNIKINNKNNVYSKDNKLKNNNFPKIEDELKNIYNNLINKLKIKL
tara:strand:+ start:3351 stop:4142 length:792 start_codon:yes stop_codon:yes gene_type:complete